MLPLETSQKTFLGFDFGTRRTGISVGQSLTRTASALTTLKSKNGKPDWLTISKLIEEWKPDALVVGIPYHMDNTPQEMTLAAQKFCRQLEGRYHLPVHEAEERLSSWSVEQEHNSTKDDVDERAAQLILQDWLQNKD